ncbi:hypothetical protein E4U58_003860 [Claviceps cyperi]|nr:hypothetical protein E4U58_003860 [Claviceps cyperi]
MDIQQTMDFESHDTGAENGPAQQASTQAPQIPDLPPSPPFDSFEDLYDFCRFFIGETAPALIKLCN